MTSRPYARVAALATALLSLAVPAAVAAPASASGSSGSAGGSGSSSGSGSSGGAGIGGASSAGPAATPVGGPVSASGNGFALTTTSVGTYKQALAFSGSVASSDAGDQLAIQRKTLAGKWQTVTESTVASDGSFSADWSPNVSGLIAFRAALEAPTGSASAASVSPASPAVGVTIYQDAIATIYGPGFYGHQTACGQTLKPTTLGVASRTLKCGTKVSIDYDGETITVPVIDRGPFANGASWDLTEATAKALGDTGTETVGAAAL